MPIILIVDDNNEIRSSLCKIVKIICPEAEIIEAGSGEEGWEKFQEFEPNVVITDLQMETPDAGLKLSQKIKMVSPSTPVIMVTASAKKESFDFVDYLIPKPFEIKFLKATLKNII